MPERELKFYVPESRRDPIYKALRQRNAFESVLHACYFDTPDRKLAANRIALRMRCEDGRWVQTLKLPGADEVTRVEISHPRPNAILDISVYEETAAAAFLRGVKKSLDVQYETRITRLSSVVETKSGAVELSYDRGLIASGGYEIPVAELEFELISGDAKALFTLSKTWARRHGLILDFRSKAERGDSLAQVVKEYGASEPEKETDSKETLPLRPNMVRELAKPRRSVPVKLKKSLSVAEAYRAIANECISQIVRNMTLIALGRVTHVRPDMMADYVHQARVGIRRLRTCWKLFEGRLTFNPETRLDAVRKLFAGLGQMRDMHIVRHKIEPMLIEAGMPLCEKWTSESDSHGEALTVAQSLQTQTLLLGLLEDVVHISSGNADIGGSRRAAGPIRRRLNRWLRQLARTGADFKALSVDEQHGLRKKVKRMRYALEFSQNLLPRKRLKRVLSSLEQLQGILGDLNDFYVAEPHYRQLAADQPPAWFAVGWLRFAQARQRDMAQDAFVSLADCRRLSKK